MQNIDDIFPLKKYFSKKKAYFETLWYCEKGLRENKILKSGNRQF